MPEVKMTEQQLNDHVNNNPMTNKRPLTECSHKAPYGPGTGREDPRAHDPKPTDDKESGSQATPRSTIPTRTRNTDRVWSNLLRYRNL